MWRIRIATILEVSYTNSSIRSSPNSHLTLVAHLHYYRQLGPQVPKAEKRPRHEAAHHELVENISLEYLVEVAAVVPRQRVNVGSQVATEVTQELGGEVAEGEGCEDEEEYRDRVD